MMVSSSSSTASNDDKNDGTWKRKSRSTIAFSLIGSTNKSKRKQNATTAALLQKEFSAATAGGGQSISAKEKARTQGRSSPLVIPLPPPTAAANHRGDEQSASSSSHAAPAPLLARARRMHPNLAASHNDKNDDDDDDTAAAARALMESANEHFATQQQQHHSVGGTNFSADGNLIIGGQSTTAAAAPNHGVQEQQQQSQQQPRKQGAVTSIVDSKEDDKQLLLLQNDLERRAENVPVDSNAYQQVPISEFGAALLRGMGWKGGNSDNSNSDRNDSTLPRPHRLGLGATPKLALPNIRNGNGNRRMRNPSQVERDRRLALQQDEYEKRRLHQVRQDKQQTLQQGSIVTVTCNDVQDDPDGDNGDGKSSLHHDQQEHRRARMVQLLGVPGLNRVMVQFEGEAQATSVKKGNVKLLSRSELERLPFQEAAPPSAPPVVADRQPSSIRVKKEHNHEHNQGRERLHGKRTNVKREDHYDNRDDGSDRKRIKREDKDDKSSRDRHDHSRREGRRDNRKGRHDDNKNKRKRSNESSGDDDNVAHHWLIANIRVRVVTKKLSSRQYKQKGLVLDVTHGGAYATLQMSDGQILDRVPERYLETALPKVGGNAIVLTGRHRLQKGKLLERSSETGKGVIQVFEDMNVVKLSLDDMAEWCGPLDDDMEL